MTFREIEKIPRLFLCFLSTSQVQETDNGHHGLKRWRLRFDWAIPGIHGLIIGRMPRP